MPPKRARAEEDVQAKETMMDIVEKRGEFDRMTKRLSRIREDIPSRDFSPNLKQDLSGLSGFSRQLRSKSCFKMSGLSGF